LFQCQCLLTLTELLKNYAAYEGPRLKAWSATITLEGETTDVYQANPGL
jgi:hypothetical protein